MSQGVAVLPVPKLGDVIYVPYTGFYAWHGGAAQQISGGQAKVEGVWVEVSGYLNVGHMVKVEGHPIPYHWENDLARIQEGLKRERESMGIVGLLLMIGNTNFRYGDAITLRRLFCFIQTMFRCINTLKQLGFNLV